MTRFTILSGAALLALAGATFAQPPGAPGGPGRPDPNADVTRQQVIDRADEAFARLDADHDGHFTREEARGLREQRRAQMGERMFDRLDLDHNGSITREEMTQAHARHQGERGHGPGGPGGRGMGHRRMMGGHGGPDGPGGPGGPGMGGRMFGEQGYVTRDQMRERALARFDRADANHDGTVTAAERQAMRGQMRERRRQPD